MNNERDTKYLGFAELLVLQLDGLSVRYKDWPDWRELDRQMKLAIAQRTYDLLFHAVKSTLPYERTDRVIEYIVSHIPDLTEWPESPGLPPPEHQQ